MAYDVAVSDAKKEKNILGHFTRSDWCPPCKFLKKDLFDAADFTAIAADYTLLYVDIPRDRKLLSEAQLNHTSHLLRNSNKRGVFPLLVIFNGKGTELDRYSGYRMNGKVQAHCNFLNTHKN